MTTIEVANAANVHKNTVLRNAKEIDGRNLGGRHGWEFPDSAPKWLKNHLHEKRRKSRLERQTQKSK